jgi:putative aldouronate transport system permease protein
MRYKSSLGEKSFDIFNTALLSAICLSVILPLLHVVSGSLSSVNALTRREVYFWPKEWTLYNLQLVLQNDAFWSGLRVSVIIVTLGTAVNLILTVLTAYPLSKPFLKGRKGILLFIIFTMVFQAPIIPTYLVVKSLGLLDTYAALIIPVAVNAFNMIICLTFFRNLPEELFDAAKIDGLSEYGSLWKIALPISKPVMATMLLFYAVSHWNSIMIPLLYITDRTKHTLQVYIYNLISQSNTESVAATADTNLRILPEAVQMSTIVLATLPIVLLYPFLQKHFIKGALLGSVKE